MIYKTYVSSMSSSSFFFKGFKKSVNFLINVSKIDMAIFWIVIKSKKIY